MKIQCSSLFTIFVWRFRVEAQIWARAWVGAWVRASAIIDVGYDQGRHLSNVSKPQRKHINNYRFGKT